MKTVLQINTVVNSGSTGRIAEEIGQTAIRCGWESIIAYGRNEKESSSKLIRIGNKKDVLIHGLRSRLSDKHGFYSLHATNEFIRQVEKIEPGIIHLHNLHGYYIHIGVLFNYLAGIKTPVVWTMHDCWPVTGHCAYFDFAKCEKWKTECHHCPQIHSYPKSICVDRSEWNFKQKKKLFTSVSDLTIVTVSDWLAGIVSQSFLSDLPVKVIHNGVDTEIFTPAHDNDIREKYNLQQKYILLGVANGWNYRKGLDDFIKLSKELEENFQIILIGLSDSQRKNLPGNIIGLGKLESAKELSRYYSAADILVNPSVEETFGMTIAEALACGTPAVVYNATACPEVISSDTGIVVEKNDIRELKDSIHAIIKNGKNQYSGRCVERAKKLFDKKVRYMDYIALYESLYK